MAETRWARRRWLSVSAKKPKPLKTCTSGFLFPDRVHQPDAARARDDAGSKRAYAEDGIDLTNT